MLRASDFCKWDVMTGSRGYIFACTDSFFLSRHPISMSIGEGRSQKKLPSFFHPIQSVGIGGEGGRKPHPFDESVVKDESNKRPSTRFCEKVTLRKELGGNKRQREGGRADTTRGIPYSLAIGQDRRV